MSTSRGFVERTHVQACLKISLGHKLHDLQRLHNYKMTFGSFLFFQKLKILIFSK